MDPQALLFIVGVLTGIAASILAVSALHVLAALRDIRRRLRRAG
jgi:hypothetical protein